MRICASFYDSCQWNSFHLLIMDLPLIIVCSLFTYHGGNALHSKKILLDMVDGEKIMTLFFNGAI